MDVAICVCTCLRPKMLSACLASLNDLVIPDGVRVSIIVIDNDPKETAAKVVQIFSESSPRQIFYFNEPRRGIPFARNTAINASEQLDVNWIAFIDDDEIADRNWLAALMAPEYLNVPVLMGQQIIVYPKPLPFWVIERERRSQKEGLKLKTAYTNNVRFSTDLVRSGLRFNETLGFMGGEDNEFFSTAHSLGFEIRQTRRAITYETMHRERLTYMAQIKRTYWTSMANIRGVALVRGRNKVVLTKMHTIPVYTAFGLVELIASFFFIAAGLKYFKRRALAGGRKIAKGVGRAAFMLGYLPEPYRNIVGE